MLRVGGALPFAGRGTGALRGEGTNPESHCPLQGWSQAWDPAPALYLHPTDAQKNLRKLEMKCEAHMFLGPLRSEKVHCGFHMQRASLVGSMEPWDESQVAWGQAAAKTPGEQRSVSGPLTLVLCCRA